MCIDVDRKEKAKKDFLAYKVVQKIKDGMYTSICKPSWREVQTGRSQSVNKILTYHIGKAVVSYFKKTAGIYVYTSRELARNTYKGKYNRKILRVKVKKGTMCWSNNYNAVLCAERIEVLKETR